MLRSISGASLAVCLGVSLAACGANPAKPTNASGQIVTKLSGTITEPVGMPILNAKVTVMAGTPSQRSAVTAVNGTFLMLAVSGPQTVAISADGYGTVTRQITIEREFVLDVELQPLVPTADIAGDWQATFEADPSCSKILPPVALARRYRVTFTQQGVSLTVRFSGADFVGNATFSGSVHADRVRASLGEWAVAGPVERVAENQFVMLWGDLSLKAAQSFMEGKLDGDIAAGDQLSSFSGGVMGATCSSTSHHVTFRR